MSEFSEAIYNRYLVHLNSVKRVESVLINIKSSEPEIVNNNESKPRNVKDVLDKEQVQQQKQVSNDVKDVLDKEQSQKQKQGEAFTKLGPAPYAGSILDDPELLWTDDIWNEEREKEAQSKLSLQGNVVSDYWKTQYETKAGSFWHKFYKRNADHFYKDRHYLHVVFPELMTNSSCDRDSTEPLYLLEIGCGVGNAVLPLIELNPNLHVIAMDFANSAIEILNKHPFTHSCVDHLPSRCLNTSQLTATYNLNNTDNSIESAVNQRVRTAVRCIVKDFLPVPAVSMDLALCMFVLSAIAPSEQLGALQKIADILKPGGKLLVRDYGRYDEAQLRFKKGSKISEHFYVRQDGTCAFFFDLAELRELGAQAGLQLQEGHYIRRQYANRQQKEARRRVWIHAKFVKLPATTATSSIATATTCSDIVDV